MHPLAAELMWDAPALWPLAMAIALGTGAAVVSLYLGQAQQASRWRWSLPALRCLAMSALAIALLKPTLRRTAFSPDQGAVLILVDRSKSMAVHDLARLPAKIKAGAGDSASAAGTLVDLADQLHWIPSGAREESAAKLKQGLRDLTALVQELARQRREFDFAKLSGRSSPAANARTAELFNQISQLAISLSTFRGDSSAVLPEIDALKTLAADAPVARWMNVLSAAAGAVNQMQAAADRTLYLSDPRVKSACDRLAGLSRFELAEQAIVDPAHGLLACFSPDVPIFGFTIGEDAQAIALQSDGNPVRRLLAQPDANRSDLVQGVRDAIDDMRGQRVQAVIVLSDGRQSRNSEPGNSELWSAQSPIFPILLGGSAAPSAVWRDDQDFTSAPIDVFSNLSAPRIKDVSVANLTADPFAYVNDVVAATATVRAQGMGDVSLSVQCLLDGQIVQTRQLDLSDDRNALIRFDIKIASAGVHDLVIRLPPLTDELSIENNSVQRYITVLADKAKVVALAGHASWDFQAVREIFANPASVQFTAMVLQSGADDVPLSADVMLLFDLNPDALTDAQRAALHDNIVRRGATLIVAGGSTENLARLSHVPGFLPFLPFTPDAPPTWQTWPGPYPRYTFAPLSDSPARAAIPLDANDDDQRQYWSELPALFRYLPAPAGALSAGWRPLLVESDSQDAVLLEKHVGRGRVLFLGLDETWRWRLKTSARAQEHFWQQLVRYATAPPDNLVGRSVRLAADPLTADPTTPIKLHLQWNRALSAAPGPPVVALWQNEHWLRDIPLAPDAQNVADSDDAPLHFTGELTGLDPGPYALHLDDEGTPRQLPLLVTGGEAELSDLSSSQRPLSQLASASGGEVLSLDQISTLPQRIAQAAAHDERAPTRPLWDSGWLFAFVLACLSAEWALRKVWGMN